jgi:hypothetical protein
LALAVPLSRFTSPVDGGSAFYVNQRAGMKIEHSPLLNDFLCFYIETRVDGELLYESVIYYHPKKEYFIKDMRSGKESPLFSFDDESTVESEIKSRVERMAHGVQIKDA